MLWLAWRGRSVSASAVGVQPAEPVGQPSVLQKKTDTRHTPLPKWPSVVCFIF